MRRSARRRAKIARLTGLDAACGMVRGMVQMFSAGVTNICYYYTGGAPGAMPWFSTMANGYYVLMDYDGRPQADDDGLQRAGTATRRRHALRRAPAERPDGAPVLKRLWRSCGGLERAGAETGDRRRAACSN